MQLNIKINFEDTYEIENVSQNMSRFQFNTIDKDHNNPIPLYVAIANNQNQFLPFVFNIAFGPMGENGEINDKAIIKHQNSSKVYSTILFGALTFLNANKGYVGIDGSDLIRAVLYYKLLQRNYDYLSQYFNLIGVKYYIRLLRGKDQDDPMKGDNDDLATQPFKIPKLHLMKSEKMFNYFIFNLA